MLVIDNSDRLTPKIREDLVTQLLNLSSPQKPDQRSIAHRQAFVGCPDARPPAYQAALGLAQRGQLQRFLTGFYYHDENPLLRFIRRSVPHQFNRIERSLKKRFIEGLPSDLVTGTLAFDCGLRLERSLQGRSDPIRRSIGRWRTEQFDHHAARLIKRDRPDVGFFFSDVGSEHAIPTCRQLGIPVVLSMVHGEVREESLVLAEEQRRSPEFFSIYLGESEIDAQELNWLHQRRLRDLEGADLIMVPSVHLAAELQRQGIEQDRIKVVPYAADTTLFRPRHRASSPDECTFLFAGGISQRKGIGYLLRAWAEVRRPGWQLQLLGAPPSNLEPIRDLLEGVDLLGRRPHQEVPTLMADADVFVFPSLFEGSAVVTYEAMAAGLPLIVTPSAGSVARDGEECLEVPPADVEALAVAMQKLGSDPEWRESLGIAARRRAEAYNWSRYHAGVIEAINSVKHRPSQF